MSVYAADHADALASIAEAGAPVTFSFLHGDGTYAADIDYETTAPAESVSGSAIRVKEATSIRTSVPETERVRDVVTLLFVPSTLGQEPRQDMLVTWGGQVYAVKAVDPVAPDGSSLLMRVQVAR